ncbi:uncharacterized protein EV422DRAFT_530652 [Fimicolochytrium jonesii]|uniref:uncharacterized protein n=1 Tax=Fimicolochytrium jonesii TaxID=1396493 RepID=UPI0022FE8456|nr:uncharacterized protein EV422DRAFT_530652 [Fimicolochytrium jonesii]KAI8820375.1 hypothetical protein EV422DRAFT_530652 [Fimicolochytrium jonesii]
MRSFVTLLLSLPALAAAQFATDCGDATQAKFNRCVSNVISVEAMVWGQLTPGTTLENACNDVRKNEAVYNCCLCESYTVVHRTW